MYLGALRSPNGKEQGIPIHHLIGASADTLPEAWDLRGEWSYTPRQKNESCQGHTYAQAMRTISKGKIKPSAMAIYNIAQWLENTSQKKLNDKGSYTNLVLDAIQNYGIVDVSRWDDDSDPTSIVRQDIFEAGSLSLINGIYRINDLGKARSLSIRRAISHGHPIPYCLDVGRSYQTYGGGIWRGETEGIIGGHANCLVGYNDECVISANSDGKNYGEFGYIRISWDYIERDGPTYDYQVITMYPDAVL